MNVDVNEIFNSMHGVMLSFDRKNGNSTKIANNAIKLLDMYGAVVIMDHFMGGTDYGSNYRLFVTVRDKLMHRHKEKYPDSDKTFGELYTTNTISQFYIQVK